MQSSAKNSAKRATRARHAAAYAFTGAFLAFTAAALVLYPERYVACCAEGIALWAECVLPSLFPFMVVSMLLIETSIAERAAVPLKKLTALFKLPETAAPLFAMSVCSGYPAGSRLVAEYYDCGALDRADVFRVCLLCSTSGPLFMMGSVGIRMFGDKTAGMLLTFAHLAANLTAAVAFSLLSPRQKPKGKPALTGRGNVLYDSFYSAVTAVAVAGGFICFFYTFARIAADFSLFAPLQALLEPCLGKETAYAVCYGLIEATGGCAMVAAASSPLALPLAGFLITFGGCSILLQQLCYLTGRGVKPAFFILFKLLQATLCFVFLLPFAAM